MNKQKAFARMKERLDDLRQEQEEKQANAAWREHARIIRGNPVRIYEGEKFLLKKT